MSEVLSKNEINALLNMFDFDRAKKMLADTDGFTIERSYKITLKSCKFFDNGKDTFQKTPFDCLAENFENFKESILGVLRRVDYEVEDLNGRVVCDNGIEVSYCVLIKEIEKQKDPPPLKAESILGYNLTDVTPEDREQMHKMIFDIMLSGVEEDYKHIGPEIEKMDKLEVLNSELDKEDVRYGLTHDSGLRINRSQIVHLQKATFAHKKDIPSYLTEKEFLIQNATHFKKFILEALTFGTIVDGHLRGTFATLGPDVAINYDFLVEDVIPSRTKINKE